MNYRDPMEQAEHDLRRDAAEVSERHAPLAPLVKTRPILFSAPMIRAILSGAKTQTRRIVKPQPVEHDFGIGGKHPAFSTPQTHKGYLAVSVAVCAKDKFAYLKRLPYGAVGDHLWVRETWAPRGVAQIGGGPLETLIAYRADGAMHTFPHHEIARVVGEWKPSIFMPRWASRITLEITDVRVERLNDISEEDAIAEGAHRKIWITSPISAGAMNARGDYGTHREGYKEIWEDINGAGSWAINPFVWCISFRRL